MKKYITLNQLIILFVFTVCLFPNYVHARSPNRSVMNKPQIINFVGPKIEESKYQNIFLKNASTYFAPSMYTLKGLEKNLSYYFKKLPYALQFKLLPVYGYVFNPFNVNSVSAKEIK